MSAPKERNDLKSFVTSRPVAVLMIFTAAVVFGFFSYGRLPVNLMPELSYPTLTIRTEYPGAAPEEVENDISRLIEEAVGVIGGLRNLSSVSRAEVSDVILEFSWDTKMSDATQDVLERLDSVFLPTEAKRPLILHFDPSLDPVMELSLAGTGDAFEGDEGLRRLRRLADRQVKRQLEPVKGVAAVRVKGGLEEEIHVLLEEEALRRTGVSIQQVINRLRQENINLAGGTIQEGRTEYLVRTLNEFKDLEQIQETIIATVDGREVRVSDLGRVLRANRDRQLVTRTNGSESVQLEIFKEADANMVALSKRIRTVLGDWKPGDEEDEDARGLAARLNKEEDAQLQLVADRSGFIESSINEVRNTAVLGGLLAVLVLFFFLRDVRTTLIIAVSIPLSLLMTFAPMNLLGTSLNIMSLGGLALGIGMLVDSSIVVLESIHRCRSEGDSLVGAAVRGTQEVRAAVIASTLTSIAVFFPMIFVEGVAGQAFGDLGLAVVVSLLASLAVAVYFIPMLASREKIETIASDGSVDWMHFNSIRGLKEAWSGSRLWKKLIILPPLYWILRFVMLFLMEFIGKLGLVVFIGTVWFVTKPVKVVVGGLLGALLYVPVRGGAFLFKGLPNAYRKFLGWSLRQPGAVAMGAILVVAVTAWVATNLQSELLPEVKQGEFTVEAQLPVGTPLEETDSVMSLIEKKLQDKKSLESLLVSVGYDPVQSQRSDEGEHTTAFKVLVDEAANEAQLVKDVRAEFQGIPDLQSRVVKPVLFSSKTPIEVEIHAEDLVLLKKLTDEATQALSEMDELADVSSTLQRGAPEIQVIYDRERLSRYGLNIQAVARLVRDKVQGFEATRFNLLDRTIPVVVRLEEPDRRSVSDVRDMIVNPGGERPVPLSAVADIQLGEAPSEIRRSDGKRVGLIRANLASGSLSEAVAGIERTLQSSVNFPMSTTYFVSGQNEEWERSKGSLYLALGLSVFLVYVIMAIQFESLLHPLIIMVTIPLAFVGTIFLLWLTQTPVSVVVFLGMIMLAGIVVNNAIVLVDYINQLRRRGLPREEAIITAGSVRLRPILMTTATTVLGLTPMALGFGDGAEIRTPMALAVISGLIVSTVLTLIVIPTVYSVADRIVGKLFRRPAEVVEGEFQPVETQS